VKRCVLQGGEGASCAATGCQELHQSSPGSINTLQNITRFHLCVAEWVLGQLSMGPTLFRPVRLSSEECVLQGVRVQVVLLQAARSCSVSPGSINTLQNITRFHLCVAEWVLGQLSMGPTLFRPVRLSSEECVLQG